MIYNFKAWSFVYLSFDFDLNEAALGIFNYFWRITFALSFREFGSQMKFTEVKKDLISTCNHDWHSQIDTNTK